MREPPFMPQAFLRNRNRDDAEIHFRLVPGDGVHKPVALHPHRQLAGDERVLLIAAEAAGEGVDRVHAAQRIVPGDHARRAP